jgi:hypothetical protein
VTGGDDVDRLQRALRSLAPDARPGPDCPEAGRLWDAVSLVLPAEERRALVDHTAGCALCAEAWRLAQEIRSSFPSERVPSRATPVGAWRSVPGLALAAGLLLAVGAGILLQRAPATIEAPGYRDAVSTAVRPLVAPDAPLPREIFRLRWSAAPAGSRYTVRVTTESLDELAEAHGLAEASYLVPGAALRSVPGGARVLWQVQVTLPDGRRVDSETFVASVR